MSGKFPFKIPNYIVKALAGSSLIWMTIFSAASIEVILATGAFDAAINIMIHKYKSSEKLLLIGTIIVFGIYGMRQNPVSMIWIYSGTCSVLPYVRI